MRLIPLIVISLILITSCKTGFTKRHYRPGIFRESIKDVQSFNSKKNEKDSSFTVGLSPKPSTNLNSRFIKDTLNETFRSQYILKEQLNSNSKRKGSHANSNFKSRGEGKKVISHDTEDTKIEKLKKRRRFIIYLALGLSLMIVLFIPLAFLVPSLLGVAFISILLYAGILVLLGLLYAIFSFVISIKNEINSNTEEKLNYEDESSWRFSKNMQRLSYLKWFVLISLSIGGIFLFIYLRTAAFFLGIGFLFSFVIAIRFLALLVSYKKCKKSLSDEEIDDYKKLKRFLALLLLVFLLIGALSILMLF
ncbi:MAG: hypothetical protein IPG89_21095 [Bacteroidetes bacterium]|nr:hypothetical protein [Bacteroidota bacterium]